MSEYEVDITFYSTVDEAFLGSITHTTPPRVGDVVWLHGEDNPWEVVRVAWSWPHPNSPNYLRGRRGGAAEILVKPTHGLFSPGAVQPEGAAGA